MDLLSSRCKIQMTTLRWIIMMTLMMRIGESMRLDLESGSTKCISDDIKINYMTVGNYSIVNPNEALHLPASHKIYVTVASPKGHSQHHAENVESGQFVFTAMESGDYTTCFVAPGFKPPAKFAVDFEWKSGVEAKDWSTIAKRGQINMMEVEVSKLRDVTESIHDEMFELREREREMQELNRSTNSRMATLSLLSIVFTLSVAGLQLYHLKSFLERKKLL
ncbi:Transmembrane emp24 domain-containing protein p24delta11 [Raphanus sativus]|uniref:Transmembrane emp24 domain-containing protein p24delta11-like n=1 Tax=Raphanus sativus TaxID=3726 RepID=A0A6J0L7C7_RAPSA|nr:transmembrane emp24 domain-containing protein p24delta11-like [Raphanus sativus]KAJ4877829.1 Transmembrane emp24 domain-containing protein p24delta11 [Raphanus sativus]